MANKKDSSGTNKPGSPGGGRARRVSASTPRLERAKEIAARQQQMDAEEGGRNSSPDVVAKLEPQPHGGALKRLEHTGYEEARAEAKTNPVADGQPEIPTMPGKNGGSLRVGNPGNRGGQPGRSGRRSDEFRDTMAALGRDPRAMVYLRRSLRGKHGPMAQISAFKYVTEQAHGKATLRAEIQGGDKPVSVIIRKE